MDFIGSRKTQRNFEMMNMSTNFKKMAGDPGGANIDSPPLLCHMVQQIFVLVIIQITIIKKHGKNK